jgi:hypothetical protein
MRFAAQRWSYHPSVESFAWYSAHECTHAGHHQKQGCLTCTSRTATSCACASCSIATMRDVVPGGLLRRASSSASLRRTRRPSPGLTTTSRDDRGRGVLQSLLPLAAAASCAARHTQQPELAAPSSLPSSCEASTRRPLPDAEMSSGGGGQSRPPGSCTNADVKRTTSGCRLPPPPLLLLPLSAAPASSCCCCWRASRCRRRWRAITSPSVGAANSCRKVTGGADGDPTALTPPPSGSYLHAAAPKLHNAIVNSLGVYSRNARPRVLGWDRCLHGHACTAGAGMHASSSSMSYTPRL